MLDINVLSDAACENLIRIYLEAKPGAALQLVDLADPDPIEKGQFKGLIKSWWPDKGYGFLECADTYLQYGCDIYINRLAIGLFQKK